MFQHKWHGNASLLDECNLGISCFCEVDFDDRAIIDGVVIVEDGVNGIVVNGAIIGVTVKMLCTLLSLMVPFLKEALTVLAILFVLLPWTVVSSAVSRDFSLVNADEWNSGFFVDDSHFGDEVFSDGDANAGLINNEYVVVFDLETASSEIVLGGDGSGDGLWADLEEVISVSMVISRITSTSLKDFCVIFLSVPKRLRILFHMKILKSAQSVN
ncbi:hypothetical protein NDU88_001981 [Pleurodeles waltl]|uniref:Uncharacterized protein n=1 Tax=Pleurodeles waltl TaxID=8319 RepID=A0AAV7Q8L8_PLEWA|nr:hypothetical protein NDU88_001981 [Pleurodeles waltl]